MIIDPKFQLKTILELDRTEGTRGQNASLNQWADLASVDWFAKEELTEEELAKLYVQVLQKANPQIIVKSVKGTTLKLADGEIYLDNLYKEVSQCSGKNEKLEVFLHFLALVASGQEHENVVLDQDNLVATIKSGEFAKIAVEKTGHIPLLPPELYVLESPLGIKSLDCGDDFTACSILSAGLMSIMQEQTPGTLLFGVPTRSELYFTTAQDAQAISHLRALVSQSWRENDHPISANLYTWQNEKIELFE